jgi:hypothetical protein
MRPRSGRFKGPDNGLGEGGGLAEKRGTTVVEQRADCIRAGLLPRLARIFLYLYFRDEGRERSAARSPAAPRRLADFLQLANAAGARFTAGIKQLTLLEEFSVERERHGNQ